MKLKDYMAENELRDEEFAVLIGRDRSFVNRLRNNNAKPSPSLMETIAEKTGGKVQPNDFFDLPTQDAA
jgi:transcriptional regulator with XRE-family HTH domain